MKRLIKYLRSSPGQRQPIRRNPPTSRLSFEPLEARWVPSFSPAVILPPAGASPQAVVTADYNGDSRLDLAISNSGNNTIGVMLGNGNSTFQTALASAAGYYPSDLLTGDLDGDAKIDLVVHSNPNNFIGDGTVRVLRGSGDGTFQSPQSIVLPPQTPPGYTGPPLRQTVSSVALGDLNADGKLDLVARAGTMYYVVIGSDEFGDIYAGCSDNYVNVLLGNGDATFGPGTAYHVNNPGYGLYLGDFTGDGRMDVATDRQLFLGNGDGTLQAPVQATVQTNGGAMVGDVNADGKLDLVNASGYSAHVKLGFGNGLYSIPIDSNLGTRPDNNFSSAALGDFDGDGFPDLAVAAPDLYYLDEKENYVSIPGFLAVSHNDGIWTLPPPPPPTIRIGDVTVSEGNTGTKAANFAVTLSRASDQNVTVTYSTANFAALAGSDYQAASGSLTIPAGQTTGTIVVLANGDRLGEQTEDFAVSLSNATNATIADGQGVGMILDDEPRISIYDSLVVEGNTGSTNATFTVSLSAAYDVNVSVAYATANGSATAGSDYTAASGSVTIAAGQTSKAFTIAVKGDRIAEQDETLVVNLSAATNGFINDSQGVGTIVDDEPRISISNVTKSEGKKDQTTVFTFTVTLSAPYDQSVTMSFHTEDGTAKTNEGDFVAKTGTLTFNPGQTTRTITIEVKGDSKREANETFYLDLSGLSSNGLFTKNRGVGTILNDD